MCNDKSTRCVDLSKNVFPCACSVKAKTFQNSAHPGTKYCHLHIHVHIHIFILINHIFIFSYFHFLYMYFHVHILENVMYASQNSTQCKLNPDIILHLVAVWESLSYTVIRAHRESPQQEVGRSEGWQPLLCVYGQYQDHCRQ